MGGDPADGLVSGFWFSGNGLGLVLVDAMMGAGGAFGSPICLALISLPQNAPDCLLPGASVPRGADPFGLFALLLVLLSSSPALTCPSSGRMGAAGISALFILVASPGIGGNPAVSGPPIGGTGGWGSLICPLCGGTGGPGIVPPPDGGLSGIAGGGSGITGDGSGSALVGAVGLDCGFFFATGAGGGGNSWGPSATSMPRPLISSKSRAFPLCSGEVDCSLVDPTSPLTSRSSAGCSKAVACLLLKPSEAYPSLVCTLLTSLFDGVGRCGFSALTIFGACVFGGKDRRWTVFFAADGVKLVLITGTTGFWVEVEESRPTESLGVVSATTATTSALVVVPDAGSSCTTFRAMSPPSKITKELDTTSPSFVSRVTIILLSSGWPTW